MKKLLLYGWVGITTLIVIGFIAWQYYLDPLAPKDPSYIEPVKIDDVVYAGPKIELQAEKIDQSKLGTSPFRPSEFSTTLNQSLTEGHNGTTLKVSSITTRDNQTLDPGTLGDTIVLHISPNKSNAEIVICTGLTVSTKTFTGCTFGYRFDTNSTSSSNIKQHAPGETVIISNDDHYLVTQYAPVDSFATIAGGWRFASTTSSTVMEIGGSDSANNRRILAVLNGKHSGYLEYNATSSKWFVSNDFVNTYDIAAGGSGLTAGKGIILTGSAIDIATTTASGLTFSDAGAPRTLSINASTTGGIIIDAKDKLAVDWTDNYEWSGRHNFNGLTTTWLVIGTANPTWPTTAGLWIGANATSTGSIAASKFCFPTNNCVAKIGQPTYATSTTLRTVFPTTAIASTTFQGGTFGIKDGFRIKYFVEDSSSSGGTTGVLTFKLGGTTLTTVTATNDNGESENCSGELLVMNNNSATAQRWILMPNGCVSSDTGEVNIADKRWTTGTTAVNTGVAVGVSVDTSQTGSSASDTASAVIEFVSSQ